MRTLTIAAAFVAIAGATFALLNVVGTLSPVGYSIFGTWQELDPGERVFLPIKSFNDSGSANFGRDSQIDITHAFVMHRNFVFGTALFLAATVFVLASHHITDVIPSNQRRWGLTIIGMFIVVAGAAYISTYRNFFQIFQVLKSTAGADPDSFGGEIGDTLMIARIGAASVFASAASMVFFAISAPNRANLKKISGLPLILLAATGILALGAFLFLIGGNGAIESSLSGKVDPANIATGISTFLSSSIVSALMIFLAGIAIAITAWLRSRPAH